MKDEKRLTVILPPGVHHEAKVAAAREGKSMSDVIRTLLEKWLSGKEAKANK